MSFVLGKNAYFSQEERHKQGVPFFCLVFKSFHVLKCDLCSIKGSQTRRRIPKKRRQEDTARDVEAALAWSCTCASTRPAARQPFSSHACGGGEREEELNTWSSFSGGHSSPPRTGSLATPLLLLILPPHVAGQELQAPHSSTLQSTRGHYQHGHYCRRTLLTFDYTLGHLAAVLPPLLRVGGEAPHAARLVVRVPGQWSWSVNTP